MRLVAKEVSTSIVGAVWRCHRWLCMHPLVRSPLAGGVCVLGSLISSSPKQEASQMSISVDGS